MRTKRPLREPARDAPGPKLKNYFTPAGLQRLKDEHRFLMNRERPAVTQVVAWALARALMKSSPGDRVVLRAPKKTDHLEMLDVEYAPIPTDPFREPPGAESATSARPEARSGSKA
jgi:hypothetical protein